MKLPAKGEDLAFHIIAVVACFILDSELIAPGEHFLLYVQFHKHPSLQDPVAGLAQAIDIGYLIFLCPECELLKAFRLPEGYDPFLLIYPSISSLFFFLFFHNCFLSALYASLE